MATQISTRVTWFWGRVFKWPIMIVIVFMILLSFSDSVAPSAIVKSLPGFSGSLPFKFETGYIAVDENEDVHFFYYFIESEGNPKDDPLMLWFTGGPGCSSISALIFEIGPIKFNMVEYNGSLPTLVLNPHSWTKVASIIFIDAPVGTGFSYSMTSQGSQSSNFIVAKRSLNFLRKWLIAHREFISNPFYLGGNSFSGMIVPIVAEEIVKSNEANHLPIINFEGYLLGNPTTRDKFDNNFEFQFAHRMALISDELYESLMKTCKGRYEEASEENVACVNDIRTFSELTDNLFRQHILEPNCQPAPTPSDNMKENRKSLLEGPISRPISTLPLPSYVGKHEEPEFTKFGCRAYEFTLIYYWANDKDVQRALNIRKGTINKWIRCNNDLAFARQATSVVDYHQRLNEKGYRALIISGDHDMVVSYIGTENWIKSLNLPIVSHWRPWVVEDQIAGYATEYSNGLIFATIKGAGHTAAEYKPKEALAMFKRWISKKPI